MNQTLEYLLIFGAAGVLFAVLYAGATDDVAVHRSSMQDRFEAYKERMQEHVVLVDAPTLDPVTIEIINVGHPINITRVFVNGTDAGSFSIHDINGTDITGGMIEQGALARIGTAARYAAAANPDGDGGVIPVAILTASGSVFRFG